MLLWTHAVKKPLAVISMCKSVRQDHGRMIEACSRRIKHAVG